jgi:very-short-patch-repair endonuclease
MNLPKRPLLLINHRIVRALARQPEGQGGVMEWHGFEVIRFQNQAVVESFDGVVQVIYEVVEWKKTPP